MDEFNHWTVRQGPRNAVKAYVVETPHASGALLMDFNGIVELGGKEHRNLYKEFYGHFLTLHDTHFPLVKRYVAYAQDMHPLLHALLDIFEVCKRARTHPLSPPNLMLMVTNHHIDTQYYLME
jgi:predicted RecB family nuclease